MNLHCALYCSSCAFLGQWQRPMRRSDTRSRCRDRAQVARRSIQGLGRRIEPHQVCDCCGFRLATRSHGALRHDTQNRVRNGYETLTRATTRGQRQAWRPPQTSARASQSCNVHQRNTSTRKNYSIFQQTQPTNRHSAARRGIAREREIIPYHPTPQPPSTAATARGRERREKRERQREKRQTDRQTDREKNDDTLSSHAAASFNCCHSAWSCIQEDAGVATPLATGAGAMTKALPSGAPARALPSMTCPRPIPSPS